MDKVEYERTRWKDGVETQEEVVEVRKTRGKNKVTMRWKDREGGRGRGGRTRG